MDIEASLRDAVVQGHTEALKFIVQAMKEEAHRTIQNSDLLHIAVKGSSYDVVTILLDCGAEVNKAVDGKYPLTMAEDRGVIELLLSRSADANVLIDSQNYECPYPLLLFVSAAFKKALQVRHSSRGESFLNNETLEIVKSLLRHGVCVDVKNADGQSALHVASERSNSKDILNLLIASGVNVNDTDKRMRTALHEAVIYEYIENVQCLIEAGIDLEISDRFGHTAIFYANEPKILEMLLQCGTDVNAVEGFYGNNLLLDAMMRDSYTTEFIEVLIRAGINLNHRNLKGDWPLFIVAYLHDMESVKFLVTSGADLNMSTQDSKNRTVITELLTNLKYEFHKTKECILFCIDHGANIAMLHPCVIHALISSGCLSLVSKFISFGLLPVQLSIHTNSKVSISPLVTALLLNHTDLAQYFINIKYLLRSDLFVLSGNSHFQQHLKSKGLKDSFEFLNRISLQPTPLKTMCFIVISDILGSNPDRSLKVQKLRLPQPIQDLLMFRKVAENFIKDASRRNNFLFKLSMKRYDSDNKYGDTTEEEDVIENVEKEANEENSDDGV